MKVSVVNSTVSAGTMQLTLSTAIMKVPTSVAIICRFWGSVAIMFVVLCYTYFGGSFCCSYEGDCFCYNYAVRRFCYTYASESFCSKYVDDKFYWNYAGGSLCSNHAGGIFYSALYT